MKPSATSTLRLLLGGILLVLLGSCQNASPPSAVMPTTRPASIPAPRTDPQPSPRPSGMPAAAWEPDWLRGQPCAIPCFGGITPGVTTVSDALQLLQSHPAIINVTVFSDSTVLRFGSIEWEDQAGVRGDAFFTPTVDIITSMTPQITPIRLDTLIAAYGAPSDVLAEEILVPVQPELEVLRYSVVIVYRHYGLTLRVQESLLTKFTPLTMIGPDTILYNPMFFAATPAGLAQHMRESERQILVPWAGYQPLGFYCRNTYYGVCQER